MDPKKIEEILNKIPETQRERLREVLEDKKPDENCQHVWEKIGSWSGEDLKTHQPCGGSTERCIHCRGIQRK
jgi:hypothetical protein